jgi:hypothetical protein
MKRQPSFGRRGVNDPEQSEKTKSNAAQKPVVAPPRCPEGFRGSSQSDDPYLGLVQPLSWCGFVIGENLSNRRRKLIDAGARHDDAVAATVSFLGDAQESPAVVLTEFHVEMLALDLQLSRLNDVIHFYLRPPTLPYPVWAMEAKSVAFGNFSRRGLFGWRDPPTSGMSRMSRHSGPANGRPIRVGRPVTSVRPGFSKSQNSAFARRNSQRLVERLRHERDRR